MKKFILVAAALAGAAMGSTALMGQSSSGGSGDAGQSSSEPATTAPGGGSSSGAGAGASAAPSGGGGVQPLEVTGPNDLVFEENLPAAPGSSTWASAPAAASWGPGRIDVIGRLTSNNEIYWSHKDIYNGQTTWTAWTELTPATNLSFQGDPCLVSWGYNRIDAFANQAGSLDSAHLAQAFYTGGWQTNSTSPYNGSNWYNAFMPTNSALTSGISCSSWGHDRLDVFARSAVTGGYYDMMWLYFNGSAWVGWANMGFNNSTDSPQGDPAAASMALNAMNVFWVAPNGDLAQSWFNGTNFSGDFQNFANTTPTDSPGAASQADQNLDIWYRNSSGNLTHGYWDNNWPGGGTPIFYTTTVAATTGPAVVSWAPGRVDLIVNSSGTYKHYVQTVTPVATQHNDVGRTGTKLDEPLLNQTNIDASNKQFLHQFDMQVDGNVYAQPLYVPQLLMSDGLYHNVLVVGTSHNSLYAFDADTGVQIWKTSLGYSVPVPNPDLPTPCTVGNGGHNNRPELGILSTPVYDPTDAASPKILVSYMTGTDGSGPVWWLDFAGDKRYCFANFDNTTNQSATCAPEPASTAPLTCIGTDSNVYPVASNSGNVYKWNINAVYAYNGATLTPTVVASTGSPTFSAKNQLQRPALLLDNGTLYAGFGSLTDAPTWYGWVFAYNAGDLESGTPQTPLQWMSTPGSGNNGGGIWQAGGGLAADSSNNVYLMTGNSVSGSPPSPTVFTNSIVAISNSGTALSKLDYFTPDNEGCLNVNGDDVDVGSGGPVLQTFGTSSPKSYLFAAGKEGRIYATYQDVGGNTFTSGNPNYAYNANYLLEEFFPVIQVGGSDSDSFTGQPVAWDGGSGPGLGSVYFAGINQWGGTGTALDLNQFYVSPSSCPTGTAKPLCRQSSNCSITTYNHDASNYVAGSNCSTLVAPSPAYCSDSPPHTSWDLPATGGTNPTQGAWMSLSANNSVVASGVLWVAHGANESIETARPGFLRAVNADTVTAAELWDSTMNLFPDDVSTDGGYISGTWYPGSFNGSKYVAPTVANGMVYLPTFSENDTTNTVPVPAAIAPYVRAYGLNGKCLKLYNGSCCDDRTVCCSTQLPPHCTNE
jgi:hypothetical protein